MTLSARHAFQSGVADDADPTLIRPSNWNADHVFGGGSQGAVLFRDTGAQTGANWTTITDRTVLIGGSSVPSFSASPILDVGATGNAQFLQAYVSDNGAVGQYNFCVGSSVNPGDPTRNNHSLSIGYNVAHTAAGVSSQAIASEPAFGWMVEDYYAPGAGQFLEMYWQYIDPAGAIYRPLSIQIDRTVGGYLTSSPLILRSNSLSYLAMNGTQYFKMQQGELLVLNGSFVDSYTNNVQWLRQAKTGGSLATLMYIDSSDRVVLGGTNGVALKASSSVVTPAASGQRYLQIDTNGVITSSASAPVGT